MIMCRELSDGEIEALAEQCWTKESEHEYSFDPLQFANLLFKTAQVKQNRQYQD